MYWGCPSLVHSASLHSLVQAGLLRAPLRSGPLLPEQQDCRCACTLHIPHAVQSMELISTK